MYVQPATHKHRCDICATLVCVLCTQSSSERADEVCVCVYVHGPRKDRRMDGWTRPRTDRWLVGWMDGWMHERNRRRHATHERLRTRIVIVIIIQSKHTQSCAPYNATLSIHETTRHAAPTSEPNIARRKCNAAFFPTVTHTAVATANNIHGIML